MKLYTIGLTISSLLAAVACQTTPEEDKLTQTTIHETTIKNSQINYAGFTRLVTEADGHRQAHRVTEAQFIEMAKDKNTLILDTRSAAAFKRAHVKGAVNLNFSDFTATKLAKTIPNKNTRILIYCNNNFINTRTPVNPIISIDSKVTQQIFKGNGEIPILLRAVQSNSDSKLIDMPSILVRNNKEGTLALNIPTYVNLYGYGYKNVYELGPAIEVHELKLKFEGTGPE